MDKQPLEREQNVKDAQFARGVRWLPVVGREAQYEVSDDGQVREAGGRVLGQWPNSQGYSLVRLRAPRALVFVHRIVGAAFIPNPKSLPFINHINSGRADNRAENLEWCTQQENLAHATALGRMKRNNRAGRKSSNAALPYVTADEIRSRYAAGGASWAALGREFKVSKRTIGRIIRGETYVGR